jgi:hypothetical protein
MKTAELKGVALDWAVAKCEGKSCIRAIQEDGDAWFSSYDYNFGFAYTKNWALSGLIIEREEISIRNLGTNNWRAWVGVNEKDGTTPLEAAMRCYVASKLGDEIDIPQELV